MTNSEIRVLKISLEKYIDECTLPAEAKRLVLVELLQRETIKAEQEIQIELEVANHGQDV